VPTFFLANMLFVSPVAVTRASEAVGTQTDTNDI
jgi:hypothetical protein